MRSLIATTLLVFCSATFAQNSINLTSWNIEWLSAQGGNVSRSENDFKKLNYYAGKTQADVIAFQEVESKDAIQKVLGDEYTIYLSDRADASNRYLQFDKSNQYTGFAVRKNLTVVDEPDFSITQGNGKLRFASYIVLRPKTGADIHLLSVHLKAGCSGAYRNNRDCQIVKQQGQTLSKWVEEREANSQQYAVLGDFNHNLSFRGDWLWETINEGSNATLTTQNARAECKVRSHRNPDKLHQFKSVIDHIIVGGQMDFTPAKQHVFKSQDVLDYKLSDHCPMSTVITLSEN